MNHSSHIEHWIENNGNNSKLFHKSHLIYTIDFVFSSEEVFDFSQGIMTQAKVKHLKDTMCSEFSEVFSLCNLVLDNSSHVPLVQATLNTLLGKCLLFYSSWLATLYFPWILLCKPYRT